MQRYIPTLSVPPMGILTPQETLPPVLESSWPSRGYRAQRVNPRGWHWHKHRPGIWPCFQLFRFLCRSWRVGEDARLQLLSPEGFGEWRGG